MPLTLRKNCKIPEKIYRVSKFFLEYLYSYLLGQLTPVCNIIYGLPQRIVLVYLLGQLTRVAVGLGIDTHA